MNDSVYLFLAAHSTEILTAVCVLLIIDIAFFVEFLYNEKKKDFDPKEEYQIGGCTVKKKNKL